MEIQISKKIYDELINLGYESCGFIYSFHDNFFNRIKKIKNISKGKDNFSMQKLSVLEFIFKNLFRRMNTCIYHVHRYNNTGLSLEDINNMLNDINYIIVCNKKLYIYIKRDNRIDSVDYKIEEE